VRERREWWKEKREGREGEKDGSKKGMKKGRESKNKVT
jgi:hypothetical protein